MPDEVSLLNLQANSEAAEGNYSKALELLERAIRLAPDRPSLVCNYAVMLDLAGDAQRARQILLAVVQALPEDAESKIQLARLVLKNHPEEAHILLVDAANNLPDALWLRCLWADALLSLGDLERAEMAFSGKSAESLGSEARALYAEILTLSNRADEALQLYQARRAEDLPELATLAVANKEIGNTDVAVDLLKRAISFRGEDPVLVWNLALLDLMQGRYAAGCSSLSVRWHLPGAIRPNVSCPEGLHWQGESLDGRTILVWEEQGFGDTINFIRYVPLLNAMGANVIIAARMPMFRLLETIANVRVLDVETPVAAHYHASTWDLMAHFLPRMGFAHTENLFRIPVPIQVQRKKPRIGLVWMGGEHRGDLVKIAMNARRSVDLAELACVLQGIDCDWVSLQIVPPGRCVIPIEDHATELNDFLDTAGLIAGLDGVVAVDTAVAHLAASMGKTVWLLNRIGGCWRWGLSGESTPWYPTMRVLRQNAYGDWCDVLQRLRQVLTRFADDFNGELKSASLR